MRTWLRLTVALSGVGLATSIAMQIFGALGIDLIYLGFPIWFSFSSQSRRIRPLSGGRVGAKWVFRGRKPRIAPERVKTAIFRVIRAQISRLYRRRWSLDQDVHGAVSGGERRADIRLRISANRARGMATSAI